VLAVSTAALAAPATADSNLSALVAQRAALQAQVGQLGSDQASAVEKLQALQDRLADLRRQVSRNQVQLDSLQARQDVLTAHIADTERSIAVQRVSLGQFAREQYKSRTDMSPDQVLFGSSNFNQVVNRVVAARAVSDRAYTLLGNLRSSEAALAAETAQLGQQQASLKQARAGLAAQRSTLLGLAADYQHQVDSLNASSSALLGKISALNRQIAAASVVSRPSGAYTLSQQQVIAIIRAAASRYNQDGDRLVRVANCESSLNPRAYDAGSGASGLFQFMPATFYGNGGHDIWDATDQSNIAAKMFSEGKSGAWSCK
jgi:peptidoglycan hydrolase CwlO-like protein